MSEPTMNIDKIIEQTAKRYWKNENLFDWIKTHKKTGL